LNAYNSIKLQLYESLTELSNYTDSKIGILQDDLDIIQDKLDLLVEYVPPVEPPIDPPIEFPATEVIYADDFSSGLTNFNKVGAFLRQGGGSYIISDAIYKSASKSIGLVIDTTSGTSQAAYLFMYGDDKNPFHGFYSANYYIPEEVVPGTWWNIMQIKSTIDGSTSKSVPMYTVGVTKDGYFYVTYRPDSSSLKVSTKTNVLAPKGSWFNLKMEYHAGFPKGKVKIFYNNLEIYSDENHPTLYDGVGEKIRFSVNNYTDNINPKPCTIYVDDLLVEKII
jgi:hypothetical protein